MLKATVPLSLRHIARQSATSLSKHPSAHPRQQLLGPFASRYASSGTASEAGLTFRLQSDLKTALKTKDSFAATTLRSVLSEVYAAQKSAPAALKPSDIAAILRKAELRRLDSMKQFESASRPDLAQHEHKEAAFLASYLPPRLPIDEIDVILRHIIADLPKQDNHKKAKGLVLKEFYSRVDRNIVDGELVRHKLDVLYLS